MRATVSRLSLRHSARRLAVKMPWSTEYADKADVQAQKPASRTTFPRQVQSPAREWMAVDTSFVDFHEIGADVPSESKETLEELWDEALRSDAPRDAQSTTSPTRQSDETAANVTEIVAHAARNAKSDRKAVVASMMVNAIDDFVASTSKTELNPVQRGFGTCAPRYDDERGLLKYRRTFFTLRQQFLDAAPLLFPPPGTEADVSPELVLELIRLVFVANQLLNHSPKKLKPESWDPRRKSDFDPIDFKQSVQSLVAQFNRVEATLEDDVRSVSSLVTLLSLCEEFDVAIEGGMIAPSRLSQLLKQCAPRLPSADAVGLLRALPLSFWSDVRKPDVCEVARLLISVRCLDAMGNTTVDDLVAFLGALLKVVNAVQCTDIWGDPTNLFRAIIVAGGNATLRRYTTILGDTQQAGRQEVVAEEGGITPLKQYLEVNNVQPFLGKHAPLINNEEAYLTHAEGLQPILINGTNASAFLTLVDRLRTAVGSSWSPSALPRIRAETLRRIAQDVRSESSHLGSAVDVLAAVNTTLKRRDLNRDPLTRIALADRGGSTPALDHTAGTLDVLLKSIDAALGNNAELHSIERIVSALETFSRNHVRVVNTDRLFLQVLRYPDITMEQMAVVVHALSALKASRASFVIIPFLAKRAEELASSSVGTDVDLHSLADMAIGLSVLNSPHAKRVLCLAATHIRSSHAAGVPPVVLVEVLQAAADAVSGTLMTPMDAGKGPVATSAQVAADVLPLLSLLPEASSLDTNVLAASVVCASSFVTAASPFQPLDVIATAKALCHSLLEHLNQRDVARLPTGGVVRLIVSAARAGASDQALVPLSAVLNRHCADGDDTQSPAVEWDEPTTQIALDFLEGAMAVDRPLPILAALASYVTRGISAVGDDDGSTTRSDVVVRNVSPQLSQMLSSQQRADPRDAAAQRLLRWLAKHAEVARTLDVALDHAR